MLPESADPRDSATAYITASIYRTLQQLPAAMTIVHFCAQEKRASIQEPVSEMMTQLISQLLASPWLRAFPYPAGLVDKCAAGDSTTLSELLGHLLGPATLPHGTVFLLIDSLMTIERDDSNADFDALVRFIDQLRRLVNSFLPGRSPIVKILILSPDFRGDIIRGSDPDDVVRVSPDRYSGHDSDISRACERLLADSF